MDAVAITGGIAQGKSTVLGYLREAGYRTTSADEIARQLWDEPKVQTEIESLVGKKVERNELREILAKSPDLRRSLNALMHPMLWRKISEGSYDFVEIPLLIETCLQAAFQRVWVVVCEPEEQLRRLKMRLGDEDAAKNLIATQIDPKVKIVFGDRIIRTDLPEAAVQSLVTRAARAN